MVAAGGESGRLLESGIGVQALTHPRHDHPSRPESKVFGQRERREDAGHGGSKQNGPWSPREAAPAGAIRPPGGVLSAGPAVTSATPQTPPGRSSVPDAGSPQPPPPAAAVFVRIIMTQMIQADPPGASQALRAGCPNWPWRMPLADFCSSTVTSPIVVKSQSQPQRPVPRLGLGPESPDCRAVTVTRDGPVRTSKQT